MKRKLWAGFLVLAGATMVAIAATLQHIPFNHTNATPWWDTNSSMAWIQNWQFAQTCNTNFYRLELWVSGLATNSLKGITNAVGYIPQTNTFGGVTNSLGYQPLTNTFGAITNALGYRPATNWAGALTGDVLVYDGAVTNTLHITNGIVMGVN